MKNLSILLLALLGWLPALADESIGLEFPVEDAKAAVASRNYEFAALEMAAGLEFPGLTEAQVAQVQQEYAVKVLNQRWRTFTNIEQRPQELRRMQSYARRYNLVMWKELQQQRVQDAKRYRY
jgi:hypothetical protein